MYKSDSGLLLAKVIKITKKNNQKSIKILTFRCLYLYKKKRTPDLKELSASVKGRKIIYQIVKVLKSYFPDLTERLNLLEDPRKRKDYQTAELVIGGIALFLFKEGSRNAFNNDRKEEEFRKNYFKIFRVSLPHMDTVEDLFRILKSEELEDLKAHYISQLIDKKVFNKFRHLGKWFLVAVDATGVHTYDENYSRQCLSKTSKNEVTTYFENVLEAKIVSSNGMAISICSEWLTNPLDGNYDKQDCEHSAFKRLAKKLKNYFPRLPICIVADGLYPNKTFMTICNENHWSFIVTFKDGNLKSIQEEISLLPESAKSKSIETKTFKNEIINKNYSWIDNLEYEKITIHWIECIEETKNIKTSESIICKFVHLTNIPITKTTIANTSYAGRLRWNIENTGFNIQKNQGYELEHKFSRVSFNATKNYYQCLQLAHIINQFVEHSLEVVELLCTNTKETIKNLWKKIIGMLTFTVIDSNDIDSIHKHRCQIRLAH